MCRLPIQLHLIYLNEVPTNADFFSLHTCGPFFVCHLRQSEVLFGENIFDIVVGPSDYHLQISLLQKIQQYTFQLRNAVFKIGAVSEDELRRARKRSIVVLKDLLISIGLIIQEESEIVRETANHFPDFSPEEIESIFQLLEEWVMPFSESEVQKFLQKCLTIHEHAYDVMRNRMSKSGKCKFFQ